MARPVRIEYPGAVYHVICRGNNRQSVFRDDQDRKRYLEKLALYCEQKGVDLLAYCLLSNHVHLLLETPKGNLSKMMQPFQTSYTVYFNKRHNRSGHVFEQRYKALLVDKDNYLLHVSRYIHLNAVEARIVERPGDYRWSSYRVYCKGTEMGAVKCQRVLEYFSGPRKRQLSGYRGFVEGELAEGKVESLPVLKQAFIGDEEFVEQARRKAAKVSDSERAYPLKRIVQAVCKVSGTGAEEIMRPGRSEAVRNAREMICYLARRHGEVGLQELTRFLGVKELSTGSHGVRRAERRLSKEADFRRQVEGILKALSHSSMQA
jgi:REP element-mobilizing transposase RayT